MDSLPSDLREIGDAWLAQWASRGNWIRSYESDVTIFTPKRTGLTGDFSDFPPNSPLRVIVPAQEFSVKFNGLPTGTVVEFQGRGIAQLGGSPDSHSTSILTVTGKAGRILVTTLTIHSLLVEESVGRLELNADGRILDFTGEVDTIMFPNSETSKAVCSGNAKAGIAPRSIAVNSSGGPASDVGEISDISLFSLDAASTSTLVRLRRIEPWWPAERRFPLESRRNALMMAHSMGMSADGNDTEVAKQRAQFWGKVSGMLHEKGASGHSQAVAREIALDTKRKAAREGSSERGLLAVSRMLGYGTKVLHPLTFWLVVSLIASVALIMLSDHSWRFWEDGLTRLPVLLFDLFVSPFQLIRPLATQSSLIDVADSGTWQRIILFLVRGVGTAAFIFSGVAVARLARTRSLSD